MKVPLLQLSVKNYKSLRDVSVRLGPLNVLIGPNASGKSNLLDVIRFLGDSMQGNPGLALEDRGGFKGVYFRGETKGPIRIHAKTQLTSRGPEEYRVSIGPRRKRAPGGAAEKKVTKLFSSFRDFNVSVQGARCSSAALISPTLRPDAANLGGFLNYLGREHADIFDYLQEDARALVPGLKWIHLPEVELEDVGLKERTPLAQASSGTLRALALLAMIYDPKPPRLTCVEGIEDGLHPYAFDRLVERLRWASGRTQLLITTHSPALVNALRAKELILCERDLRTGESLIPATDPKELLAMEESARDRMRLGDLWFTGSMGGVPR